mmetsp:Transcript_92439/g.258346  ORF Transcript_92439/g.258346 Transcript_92439/m.258346 type:complete len:219 (+) Transcript_92439:334-990(+)
MGHQARSDQVPRLLILQLHVLRDVPAEVVEEADDVEPQADRQHPWLATIGKVAQRALPADQAEHRQIIGAQRIHEHEDETEKVLRYLPSAVWEPDVLVDPEDAVRRMRRQEHRSRWTPSLREAEVATIPMYQQQVHRSHQELVKVDALTNRERAFHRAEDAPGHVDVVEPPQESNEVQRPRRSATAIATPIVLDERCLHSPGKPAGKIGSCTRRQVFS